MHASFNPQFHGISLSSEYFFWGYLRSQSVLLWGTPD
jgi:hypothetical protein